MNDREPLDYERAKAFLEAELRHVNALIELQTLIRDMKAWLDGNDTPAPTRATASEEEPDGEGN